MAAYWLIRVVRESDGYAIRTTAKSEELDEVIDDLILLIEDDNAKVEVTPA